MGSILSSIYDEENEMQFIRDTEYLDELAKIVAKEIKETKTNSSDFNDIKWLYANKAKILRNKKLIDLIG